MNINLDYERLRRDLKKHYTKEALSVDLIACLECLVVDAMSPCELVREAISLGFRLEDYELATTRRRR